MIRIAVVLALLAGGFRCALAAGPLVEAPEPEREGPVTAKVEPGIQPLTVPELTLTPTAIPLESVATPEIPVAPTQTPTPEAAAPSIAAPAAEAAARGFAVRVKTILARLADPFGTAAASEAPATKSAAQEGFARFTRDDFWARSAAPTREEIAHLRGLKSKAEAAAYVRGTGQDIIARIESARGTGNIGFHYNLHGGTTADYVKGGGIRATMGDIANNYSMHGDRNLKVYFFQSKNVALYDILNEKNPAILFFPSRMGSTLSLFRLDAPELIQAIADGRIKDAGAISMDFHGMPGVPYSAFLAPPLDVFNGVAKKIGFKGRLSRDEETLAVMRYIEAAALAGERYLSATHEPSPPASPLGLEGLTFHSTFAGGQLHGPAGELDGLGRGNFGIVYDHPKIKGAVIKLTDHAPEILMEDPARTHEQTADDEDAVLRRLAGAGLAPQVLGKDVIGGRPVSVREKIYGETLEDLIARKGYGPAEHALVMDLLARAAAQHLFPEDMRPPNIMIGTTLRDPVRRAYVVDSTRARDVDPGVSVERLREDLYRQEIVVSHRRDPFMGPIVNTKPLNEILDKALGIRKPWRQRFAEFLHDLFANASISAP